MNKTTIEQDAKVASKIANVNKKVAKFIKGEHKIAMILNDEENQRQLLENVATNGAFINKDEFIEALASASASSVENQVQQVVEQIKVLAFGNAETLKLIDEAVPKYKKYVETVQQLMINLANNVLSGADKGKYTRLRNIINEKVDDNEAVDTEELINEAVEQVASAE